MPANCTTFGPALQNLLLLPGPYLPTASTSSSWRHSNQYIPKHNFVGRKKFPAPIHVLTVPSHLGHVYTPDTSKPKCHEPLYSPWPFGPVHTPAPWALPSSQPPQYVPPSSKSNRPPFTPWAWATVVPEAAAPAAAAMAATVTWLWVRVAKPSLFCCYTYMSNGTSTAYWPPGRAAASPEYTVSVGGGGLTSAEAGSHPDLTMLSSFPRSAGGGDVPSRHSRPRSSLGPARTWPQVRGGGGGRAPAVLSPELETGTQPAQPTPPMHSTTTSTTPLQSQFFSEKPNFSELPAFKTDNCRVNVLPRKVYMSLILTKCFRVVQF